MTFFSWRPLLFSRHQAKCFNLYFVSFVWSSEDLEYLSSFMALVGNSIGGESS